MHECILRHVCNLRQFFKMDCYSTGFYSVTFTPLSYPFLKISNCITFNNCINMFPSTVSFPRIQSWSQLLLKIRFKGWEFVRIRNWHYFSKLLFILLQSWENVLFVEHGDILKPSQGRVRWSSCVMQLVTSLICVGGGAFRVREEPRIGGWC